MQRKDKDDKSKPASSSGPSAQDSPSMVTDDGLDPQQRPAAPAHPGAYKA
ncbi:MAG: hypothetical protein ACFB13_06855 [Kiloniellaceae bacterium]